MTQPLSNETIVVLDLGSQYTQLIARRIRELNIYAIIVPYTTRAAELDDTVRGVILSGGPGSIYEDASPKIDPQLFELGVPILGICYGLQLVVERYGGRVEASARREYGRADCAMEEHPLFAGLPPSSQVWMSRGDHVAETAGFRTIAATDSAPHAAVHHSERPVLGIQFHPEVSHTEFGKRILKNFCRDICGCHAEWRMASFIDQACAKIREQVGDGRVVLGLSGGVDSSVAALLLQRAIGDQLTCIFVDNGLLRAYDRADVEDSFRPLFGDRLIIADATDAFFEALAGVTDPEEKRKRIGHAFIDVFKREAAAVEELRYLAQGTLYPDVIESVSAFGGPSATIKSHHNVGGLPDELGFELVEPLRDLFKDEVRLLGEELGLAEKLIRRQPFPGPGLAIRILGEVTRPLTDTLRRADSIVYQEFHDADLLDGIWQAFPVLLPVQSVGVMGDKRTYENACVLRVVDSVDGMTADWIQLPKEFLARLSNRIINEVPGINRVCLDISSKPPATIEWE